MIAAVIEWCLRFRVLVILITAMLCLAGWQAVRQTPVDAIPDLSDVQVIVKTRYPGQAPSVVENQVTYPLSTALLSVPGAQTVRGFSFYGDSYVYVIFDENTDLYWARSRVLEYLNQVSDDLPEGVRPQLGPDASGIGWIYIYALSDPSGQHDLAQLRRLQDWVLKYELQSISGVAEVAPVGGMVKQYQVQVDPQQLLRFGIPLSHIRTAIDRSNRETGVSVIEMAEAEYMLHATGYINGAAALRDVPIGMRDGETPIYLHHVADIQEAPSMRRGIAELNGKGEAVGGIIVMRHGENAQATIDAVKQKLASLERSLPEGVEITTVYDRSRLIERAIDNLMTKLGLELLVVALVLFCFLLNARSVLVALVTLPIGILISFLIMRLQGINANIMSLGGIAIAIGAMIDGAIVMIENLHRRLSHPSSQDRLQQVLDSAREVGPTLFFSLLIITLSFIPVLALEGEEGRLFQPLALTKTYAMAASAVISITLMPVLLYYFVRRRPANEAPAQYPEGEQPSDAGGGALQRAYRQLLHAALMHPRWMLVGAIGVAALAILPMQRLSSEFMPPLDEGDLMYMPTTYAGISVGKARELLQQTDKIIGSLPEVESVFGKVGRAETATDPAPLTMIETFIQLKPRDQWRPHMTTDGLIAELERKVQFPGVTNAWVMPIRTRIDMLSTGMKTPLGIKLAGPDIATLQSLGEELEKQLQALPATQSVYAERSAGGRYLIIDIDRRMAARYGLTIAQVQQWLRMAVGGMPIGQSVEGAERYPISVRFPDHYRDSPERLRDLPLVTPTGAHIRLADVAELTINTGAPMLKSENGRLNTWLFLDVGDADISNYVAEAEAHIESVIAWPPEYSMRWSGQYESIQRVRASMSVIIPMTLIAIAILLYWNFRRFSDVAILLLTLPFALVGGLWLVYLMGFKVSVAVVVGFIAVAGLAVETGAIMLQVLRSHTNEINSAANAPVRDAILSAAGYRLRPVLMTATSTIAGLLPVMFGSEPGSEVMSRIAAPMIGGLVTTVLLTLFVIPVFFQWLASRPQN